MTRFAALLAGLTLATIPAATQGASETWSASAASTGYWGTTTNWSNSIVPGSTSGITNTDIATFLTSTTTTVNIDNSSGVGTVYSIGGINFGVSGSTPSAFTIGGTGGSALDLSSGGIVQILSGATGSVTETVNAPLVLEPASSSTAGAYSFTNNSASDVLNFGGGITGGTTSAGITLTLNGTNTGTEGTISGVIGNGGAGGGVSLFVGGSGNWILTNTNTYTGGTTINSGTLTVSNGGTNPLGTGTIAIGSGSTLSFTAGGTFSNTVAGSGSFINSGGAISPSGNWTNFSGAFTASAQVQFTGLNTTSANATYVLQGATPLVFGGAEPPMIQPTPLASDRWPRAVA